MASIPLRDIQGAVSGPELLKEWFFEYLDFHFTVNYNDQLVFSASSTQSTSSAII